MSNRANAIITVWDAETGEPAPEGTPDGVIRIEKCTACDTQVVTWAEDRTHGRDPWKKHFDYCPPETY